MQACKRRSNFELDQVYLMYIALNTKKLLTILFCVYYINAERIESIENTLQKI